MPLVRFLHYFAYLYLMMKLIFPPVELLRLIGKNVILYRPGCSKSRRFANKHLICPRNQHKKHRSTFSIYLSVSIVYNTKNTFMIIFSAPELKLKCTIVITRCPSSVLSSSVVVNFSHFRRLP